MKTPDSRSPINKSAGTYRARRIEIQTIPDDVATSDIFLIMCAALQNTTRQLIFKS